MCYSSSELPALRWNLVRVVYCANEEHSQSINYIFVEFSQKFAQHRI